MANCRIGTSGWSYDHWTGPFYPSDLPPDDRLAYYARRLRSAEINNTFYHLPSEQTLAHWRDCVPADFRFAAKASRYITHMKKLKDPQDTVPNFMRRVEQLGDRLGPILFQLPPNWHRNTERLQSFLEALDEGPRYAFELRDRSWIDDSVLGLLADAGAAFCIYELDGFLSPMEVTADFVYVRLHGPDGAYRGDYADAALDEWAERIVGWLGEDRDVFCYFDNDEAGYAARDALSLGKRLDEQLPQKRQAGA